jgi:hypothetical protein
MIFQNTTAPMAASTLTVRPEFFRLPKTKENDPFFGFSRSYYYYGESQGFWHLVRLRPRGKQRGVVLVPYDQVLAYIRQHVQNGAAE